MPRTPQAVQAAPGRFRVCWSMDIEAADAAEAAQLARAAQLRTGAAVFDVERHPDDRQGKLLLGLTSTRVAVEPAKPAPKAAKPAAMDGEAFYHAIGAARRAAIAELGLSWRDIAGATVLVDVPPRLRSFRTERGAVVRMPRDHRVPVARFWPGGNLPAALTVTLPYAGETSEIVCPGGVIGRAYEKWLRRWRKAKPETQETQDPTGFWRWIAAQPKDPDFRYSAVDAAE